VLDIAAGSLQRIAAAFPVAVGLDRVSPVFCWLCRRCGLPTAHNRSYVAGDKFDKSGGESLRRINQLADVENGIYGRVVLLVHSPDAIAAKFMPLCRVYP
jgi:hypothetical protein